MDSNVPARSHSVVSPLHLTDRTSETTTAGISWLGFHKCRIAFLERWPTTWHLRTERGFFEPILTRGNSIKSVLDVGATSREWEPTIRRCWPGVDYKSLDIDRESKQDFYSFQDVDRCFDLVTLTEVLEHVTPATALALLADCAAACKPGGLMLVSVPNVLTPGCQLEFTHQTAYSYWDLAGVLAWTGFEVIDGWRFFPTNLKRRFLHKYLLYPVHRAMQIDFCRSVVMLGRRPLEQTNTQSQR